MTFINIFISKAFAQSFNTGLPLCVDASGNTVANCSGFRNYFESLVNVAVIVAVAISVLIVVYAGFLYSRSQGRPEQISQAKELVAGVAIGLALLFLIKLILPTIGIQSN